MLSRTAENLYWLARYVERAEYLARTIEATLRVTALPHTYIGQTNEWDSALLTAGAVMALQRRHALLRQQRQAGMCIPHQRGSMEMMLLKLKETLPASRSLGMKT